MGIRLDHDHGRKQCYVTRSRHTLTKKGIFVLGEREVTGAYMGYSGSWYFWDPATGEEVATIRSRFWDSKKQVMVDLNDMVEAMRIGDLIEDPDCVIGAR